MKLKSYNEFVNESSAQMGITSIDNPGGFVYNPVVTEDDDDDEEKTSNYMFFSNLKRIGELASMILKMDKEEVDELLNNGHDWATTHINTAKVNLDHVYEWLKSEIMTESVTESFDTTALHRRYTMTPKWWAAWRLQNEKPKKLSIEKDAFAKCYQVKNEKGEVLFVFDYARNIIFTNEKPDKFTIDDEMSNKDMEKVEKGEEKLKDDLAGVSPEKKKEMEKEKAKAAEKGGEEE
jgi:hypothetical protein